jgi:hypothetical protein
VNLKVFLELEKRSWLSVYELAFWTRRELTEELGFARSHAT